MLAPCNVKNHTHPRDCGAEGVIERNVQRVLLFVVAKHVRPHDALQLGIEMREKV